MNVYVTMQLPGTRGCSRTLDLHTFMSISKISSAPDYWCNCDEALFTVFYSNILVFTVSQTFNLYIFAKCDIIKCCCINWMWWNDVQYITITWGEQFNLLPLQIIYYSNLTWDAFLWMFFVIIKEGALSSVEHGNVKKCLFKPHTHFMYEFNSLQM